MRLRNLDLNLLLALHALIEERNISHAASRVGMSQPAMSKALRRLRVNFDDELLVRVGREYSLTPFAQELSGPIQEILLSLEHTMDRRPRFNPREDRRRFRIVASDAMEYLLIRPLLKRVADEAPHVSLDVRSGGGPPQWHKIEDGALDLGLYSLDYYDGNLSRMDLFSDRSVCCVWNEHPHPPGRLTEEELATIPHAAYNWPGYEQLPDRWKLLQNLPVRIADEHHVNRLLLLEGTNMVTFTWEKLAHAMASIANVRTLEPPGDAIEIHQGMVWHPRNETEPAHCWLRGQLADIASAL
jgi:DNA-binding transcriptional LysR family regulator